MTKNPAASLTAEQTAKLRAIAAVVAPRTPRMPSADDIDLVGAAMEPVFLARPDLLVPLRELLDGLDALATPSDQVAGLARENGTQFAVLMQVVAGAYYMDARVRRALEYTGQHPAPFFHLHG